VLHEKVMLLSVMGEEIHQVEEEERVRCREMGEGFYEVLARYGFMETPDVPAVLQALARASGNGRAVPVKVAETTFYLGRETLIPSGSKGPRRGATPPPPPPGGGATLTDRVMARWRQKLFIFMARNAQSATAFFGLPPNRVVELGAQIRF